MNPGIDSAGKSSKAALAQPVARFGGPRFITAARHFFLLVGVLAIAGLTLAGDSKDTKNAAETRKRLKEKITIEFSETPLDEAMGELKGKIKGLGIHYDAGVSRNVPMTFKGAGATLAEVLDGMFKNKGLGYVVISKEGNAYDGNLLIKQGPERGYYEGDEPAKDEAPKAKGKEKSAKKGKPDPAPAPESDAEKQEADAARKVKFAKELIELGKKERAKERLTEVVDKYGSTKAAAEAREILKNWKDD
jgi:hypothetical protein